MLHFNAVEPGITQRTTLGGESTNAIVLFIFALLWQQSLLYSSTPKMATKVIIDHSGKTGIYYDEKVQPMFGSELSLYTKYQDLVIAETRVFLSKVPQASKHGEVTDVEFE